MLKQKLQQKLLQKLSPQQIQMIKLLEVPTLQIEQRIKKELEENPALEEGAEDDEDTVNGETEEEQIEETDKDQEEFTLDDYIEEDEIPEYRLQVNNYSKEDEKRNEINKLKVSYRTKSAKKKIGSFEAYCSKACLSLETH